MLGIFLAAQNERISSICDINIINDPFLSIFI